jgi:tetratricopeptide (TPR) repeat protein
VADALSVTLSPAEDRRIRRHAIPDGRAYECYLRAREAMHGLSPEQLRRATSLLRTGLKVGGDNALLYAGLGSVYAALDTFLLGRGQYVRRIEVCARKALALDPESAEAHFLTGLVWCRRANIKEGAREMLRALAIDPDYTDALFWCSAWLGSLGKVETARPLVQRLLETDPLTPSNLGMAGWVEWMSGRFEAAVGWHERWLEFEPRNPSALHVSAQSLIWSERFEEARVLLEQLATVAATSPVALFNESFLHALNKNTPAALAAVTSEVAATAGTFDVACWSLAGLHAMLNARDEALAWLDRAVRRGFINYPMLAEYDPFLKRLRGDARFSRLLDDVKREWETLDL